jgi:hypothetical protein
MTTPAALRDLGHALTTEHADPRLVLAVDRAIAAANASGSRWSANSIRDALPIVAGPLVGARIRAAAMRKPTEMRRVGMTRSSLLSTRSAWIAVWQGTPSP